MSIIDDLNAQRKRVGSLSMCSNKIVNAGDRISEALGYPYRPKIFQDLRDEWADVSDLEILLKKAVDQIEYLEKRVEDLEKDLK